MEGAEKKYTIDDFRAEIEHTASDSANEGDFPEEINSGDLNEEDMRMWEKIRGKTVTMPDVIKYKKNFEKERGFESTTRYNFLMFVANKANVIIGERELGG